MGAFGFALPSGSGPWFAGRARQPRGTRRLRSASDAAAGSAPGQQQVGLVSAERVGKACTLPVAASYELCCDVDKS